MNDITALMATMKAAAEKATPGRIGDRIDGSGSIKYECLGYDGSLVLRTDHKNMEYGFVGDNGTADEEFFRACVPDNILALVEALEKAQQTANINNWWKPDVCPITGRRFFMWIEHPDLGYVPTYGGPYDSYTIPTRDDVSEFSCERYDHDVGDWVDGECAGLYVIDEDEICRVHELEQSVAELREQLRTVELSNSVLESRTVTVKLPELCVGVVQGGHAVMVPYAAGHWFNKTAILEMLAAVGIQVIEGDE